MIPRWVWWALLAVAVVVGLAILIDWRAAAMLSAAGAAGWAARRGRPSQSAAMAPLPPDSGAELADLARDQSSARAETERQATAAAAEGEGPSPAALAASRRGRR